MGLCGGPARPHRLCSCPAPSTSAAGSAGSGCGWPDRSGSCFVWSRSMTQWAADCAGKIPEREKHKRYI